VIVSPSGTISRSHAHTNNPPTFFTVPLPSCTLTARLSLRFSSRTARSWNDPSDPMLITPRTYSASQTPDQAAADCRTEGAPRFYTLAGWRQSPVEDHPSADMLLVHQTGSVRVGEIIRYVIWLLQTLSKDTPERWAHEQPCLANKWSYNEGRLTELRSPC
jgi:hypothetical protein